MAQDIAATIFFGGALAQTFLVKKIQHLATSYPEGSVLENLFHLLGEVEVVFGMWSALYLLWIGLNENFSVPLTYLEGLNFTEPAFVFVVMVVCATKPILASAEFVIERVAKLIPIPYSMAMFWTTLTLGPLLGSLITEPAAMTLSALLLLKYFFNHKMSSSLQYATIGLLFVNVSIGGTLTSFAAPPVLMVAAKWGWDLNFMLTHFAWKALSSIILSTTVVTLWFRDELSHFPRISTKRKETKKIDSKKIDSEKLDSESVDPKSSEPQSLVPPFWIQAVHLMFLGLIVVTAHHLTVFVFLFLFFLGLANVTKEYHSPLKIREGLLVAFFLGGLVILGGPQRWWLEPLLTSLNELGLYCGAVALTAFTDNAALTYLGSQVSGLTAAAKYFLVAGSVVGGGLTVIANAPNPAGYGILNKSFGNEGISPGRLFLAALLPTTVAFIFFLI